MRLLRVPTGSGEVIDLHPAVSMVTGLTAEQRQALIDLVAGLPAGEARGAGLVEAHDVLFDLDDDVLDLFELGGHPVDPVVGPRAHLVHDADADGEPAPGPTAAEPTGDDAPSGSEALDAARGEVDEARSAPAPAADALDAATTELRSRRDDLEARRSELIGLLTVLDDDPADEMIELLAELDDADHASADHDPDALALADEITALVAELDGLPAVDPGSPSLDTARQRLDRARVALEEAEAARHDPPPDDAALAIEQAHEELLAALDEAERRFRRARAQQRVEAARAAEQAALAALGHNSYTDFLTGRPRSTRNDGVAGADADAARSELAAAEQAVARAEAATRAEQRRTEVSERLADALERAAAVVGRPLRDEPLRVARALRTVVAEPPDRRNELVGALSRAGVVLSSRADDGTDEASGSDDPRSEAEPDPDADLDLDDLELLARALVDEAQTSAVRRRTALAELAEVESALATVEAQLAESVATTEARLADAEAQAAATIASIAPAEVASPAPPAEAADQAADGPASLGWYVLSRMAAQRAVSYVGGLPLVLDRTLDSLDPVTVREVLGRLEPTTSAVQLIVLTESEEALRWAEEVGPDRAAVVRPGPVAA